MPPCDPDPEWFDRPAGAATAVAISGALCVAVGAEMWSDPSTTAWMAAVAASVSLGLSLANLRDARRRARRRSMTWAEWSEPGEPDRPRSAP